MEVINLGNFGQRRPSPFAEVPNALQEGLRTGAEQGKNIAEIKNMAAQRSYQQQELKVRQAELTRQVDKDNFEKEMKQSEHGKVVAEDLALKLNDMDPQMKAMALQSKPVQEVLKGLSKTNKEYFGDNGEFIGPDVSKVIAERTKQGIDQVRLNALKRVSSPNGYPALDDPEATKQDVESALKQQDADNKVLNNFRYNPDNAPMQAWTGSPADMQAGNDYAKKAGEIVASHHKNPPPGVTAGSPQHHNAIADALMSITPVGIAARLANMNNRSSALAPNASPVTPMAPQSGVPQQGGGVTNSNDPANVGV